MSIPARRQLGCRASTLQQQLCASTHQTLLHFCRPYLLRPCVFGSMRGASEDLLRELLNAEAVLDKLARKLEGQFSEKFDNSGVHNPMSILKRVQKLQGELPEVRAGCQELIERKQALIDVAKQHLLQNRRRLQVLAQQAGCALPDDSEVHEGFTQAMAEWGAQVAGNHQSGAASYQREDLNKALANSMLTR